ncbi:MAG: hypothetical protein QOF00_199 [Pseudonocardiales bacterium]|nr:hypothetical protein [Pseudonocardiales bacterium]
MTAETAGMPPAARLEMPGVVRPVVSDTATLRARHPAPAPLPWPATADRLDAATPHTRFSGEPYAALRVVDTWLHGPAGHPARAGRAERP